MDERQGDLPGRRAEDKRFANLQAQLTTTRQSILALESTVEELKDELKTFDASLYGGVRDKDSIHFRLKQVEHNCDELIRVVIGDSGGNGGIKKMVEGMSHTLETVVDAIHELKESGRDRATRWSAVIVAIVTSLGLVFTNLDKIALATEKFMGIFDEPRTLDAEAIRAEIQRMRQTRGPEVEKKLKMIERAARGR